VRLNCAAIPKELLEAELFGYEPGAFTGAGSKGKAGKFELAHRGTIFLDEIGELPLEMQPKLLRVIEEKEIERLGGTRVSLYDFRLIAATQENLGQSVEQGKFRKDLYYRLNVIPVQIPPLRDRMYDIRTITEHLVQSLNKDLGMNVTRISPEVMNIFEKYNWPGNVRELSNVLERILYSMEGDTIGINQLPFFLQSIGAGVTPHNPASLKSLREEMEREALVQAIRLANNNKKKASEKLGIHRTALYKKMKKLNIPVK